MPYGWRIRLELGTPVRCSDGMLGELADLVIDPVRRCVTHLVVRPRHQDTLLGPRLVPIDLSDSGEDGAEIGLRCTLAEAGKLEPVQELTYLRLNEFPVDDPDWDVGVSDVLAAPYYGPASGQLGGPNIPESVAVTYDRIPKDEVEIRRSSAVLSTDGHELGQVEAFILDEQDKVTHFVLERGHLWGKREITIPIGKVTQIETDQVTVDLTKDQVGAPRRCRSTAGSCRGERGWARPGGAPTAARRS